MKYGDVIKSGGETVMVIGVRPDPTGSWPSNGATLCLFLSNDSGVTMGWRAPGNVTPYNPDWKGWRVIDEAEVR